MTDDRDERLARILIDLADRAQRGEAVDIHREALRHPDLDDELRELWGAVMLAEAVGSHVGQLTETTPAGANHSATLSLPYQFGDFELLEEVGRGGMGIVYRAQQVSLDREVAVKMVLEGQLASAEDQARFRSEAESAARLDHPGIVPVYEVGELDGRQYFIMKFIRGRTLADVLVDGPLRAREAARILAAVSRAVDFAHRHGVLHRDLKPSNILLDDQGQPHVADFGLAKRISHDQLLTRSGAVLGTPTYMAPEQAVGNRSDVGPATDVYSLGTILYHMLTGRPPFQAASTVDTLFMVIEQDPVPPRILNTSADRDLEMISLRCLQKPTDLRYDSAALLAKDLEAFLHDEPIAARSGRFLHVMARWFRETHHAIVLENWGLLWMWHSLALLTAGVLTNLLQWYGVEERLYYFGLWTAGLGTWAAVFWALRRRMGPVTFVERQIAHVWAASMISIALLFPLEAWLGLDVLTLSPVLGLSSGMVFLVKAGILSGRFYIQSAALFATAGVMAMFPSVAHLIFGAVSAACFFFPGLKYYRQRKRSMESFTTVRASGMKKASQEGAAVPARRASE